MGWLLLALLSASVFAAPPAAAPKRLLQQPPHNAITPSAVGFEAASELMSALGCHACHSGSPSEGTVRSKAPNLEHAGRRYQPAYLFDYLQNPVSVRHDIAPARMPDFHFSSDESLALTLFLSEQLKALDDSHQHGDELGNKPTASADPIVQGKYFVEEYACASCHVQDGSEVGGPALAAMGYRLNSKWVEVFLASSHAHNMLTTPPPSAAEWVESTVEFLFSLAEPKRQALQEGYEAARKLYPNVSAADGKSIFISQNCVACHEHSAFRVRKTAPNLGLEGARVKRAWLKTFLQNPQPIRPFGYPPGSGSRMPNFNLNDDEVALLTDYLAGTGNNEVSPARVFEPNELSAFSMAKARRLITEKLSCLGCHQLGQEGGKIGPRLSGLKQRLKPLYVYSIMEDPQAVVPDTIMPEIRLSAKTLKLLVNYLLQEEGISSQAAYPSLMENPVYDYDYDYDGGAAPAALYRQYCAPCHGNAGDAKGFNAKHLSMPPRAHADTARMAKIPDDTLFDGIYGGGYVLNKSPRMPPWGATLSRSDIRGLVDHIRRLCGCVGPRWSLDN